MTNNWRKHFSFLHHFTSSDCLFNSELGSGLGGAAGAAATYAGYAAGGNKLGTTLAPKASRKPVVIGSN